MLTLALSLFTHPIISAAVGMGLYLMYGQTAAQKDATANAAIQAAISNFAGPVAQNVASAVISSAMVTGPAVLSQLETYLSTTVKDSVARLKVSPDTMAVMLEGKVKAILAAKTVVKV